MGGTRKAQALGDKEKFERKADPDLKAVGKAHCRVPGILNDETHRKKHQKRRNAGSQRHLKHGADFAGSGLDRRLLQPPEGTQNNGGKDCGGVNGLAFAGDCHGKTHKGKDRTKPRILAVCTRFGACARVPGANQNFRAFFECFLF